MKILLLSRYDRMGASSRIRSYQYLPYLRRAGFQIEVSCLFGNDYASSIHPTSRRNVSLVLRAYLGRLRKLLLLRQFDLVWIEKEILPWLPDWAEKIIRLAKVPYIVDFDDAIFHRYDLNRSILIRRILGKKLDRIMAQAQLVITGNHYLARRAEAANSRHVCHLPSVVDIARYAIKEKIKSRTFTIGWIGSPTTSAYLSEIAPALELALKHDNTRLIVVGAGNFPLRLPNVFSRRWTEETEVRDILDFDVGIMPLPDTPWTRGKCGYKLIQYMACGLPVIASPVGANIDIVKSGANGFLSSESTEWTSAIRKLRENPDLRCQMGTIGRKMVERNYCLQVTAPKLKEMLQAMDSNPTHYD